MAPPRRAPAATASPSNSAGISSVMRSGTAAGPQTWLSSAAVTGSEPVISTSWLCTATSPRLRAAVAARCRASASSCRPGGGTASRSSSRADSRITPVGRPTASRSMAPPGGSGVASPIPAACRAALLSTATCPHWRSRKAGCSGATASRSWREG